MSEENQAPRPPVMVHHQYIRDLSLEIPHAPEIFKENHGEPKINVSVDINAKHLEENLFCVELDFHLEGDVADKKLFILEMAYGGVAALNVPQEHVEPVLMIEVPHLMFPYARQAISATMANGGLPPLMLNPIDFVGMYQARHPQQPQQSPQPQGNDNTPQQ